MEHAQSEKKDSGSRKVLRKTRLFDSAVQRIQKQNDTLPCPNYNDHLQSCEGHHQRKVQFNERVGINKTSDRIPWANPSFRGDKTGFSNRNSCKLQRSKSVQEEQCHRHYGDKEFNDKFKNTSFKKIPSEPRCHLLQCDPPQRKITLSEFSGDIRVNVQNYKMPSKDFSYVEKEYSSQSSIYSETLKPSTKYQCKSMFNSERHSQHSDAMKPDVQNFKSHKIDFKKEVNQIHNETFKRFSEQECGMPLNSESHSLPPTTVNVCNSQKTDLNVKIEHSSHNETLKLSNKHELKTILNNDSYSSVSPINFSGNKFVNADNSYIKSDSRVHFKTHDEVSVPEDTLKEGTPEQKHLAMINKLAKPNTLQIEAINNCLLDLSDNKLLQLEDIAIYEETLKKMNQMLKKHKEGYEAILYGSMKSGFGLTESDVNVNLRPVSGSYDDMLISFYQVLKRNEDITRLEKNMENKPPFITFEVLDLDLPWKVMQKDDLACKTAELLSWYCSLDIRVKFLGSAFRYWGKICDISEEEEGTLHSLCFPLMLIHFLQQQEPPVLPVLPKLNNNLHWSSKNKKEIGELWLDLLRYYGSDFNWTESVVTILKKENLTKKEKQWNVHSMAVEEPCSQHINVAKSVLNNSTRDFIKQCFQSTHLYFAHPQWSQCDPILSPLILDDDNLVINEDDDQNGHENDEYFFKFSEQYFTGNKLVPVHCTNCDEKGHGTEECPAASVPRLSTLPPMKMAFQKNIDEFCKQMYESYQLRSSHVDKRSHLVTELRQYLKQSCYFNCSSLEMFGSSVNGFGFVDSDVDLCLKFPDISNENLQHKQLLKYLVNHLRKNKCLRSIFLIGEAKVPVIKFIHLPSRLKGDISLCNTLGVHNSQLLNTYSKIDPRCKYLGYAARVFFRNSRLAELSSRGLTSYAYLLLIIHFLQQRDPPVLPILQQLNNEDSEENNEVIVDGCNVRFYQNLSNLPSVWPFYKKNTESVGELFLKFFQYYTEQFDRTKYVVTIRQKEPLLITEKMWNPRFICIEDPFDVQHNLGARIADDVGLKTMKAFQIGRQLFGTPIENVSKHYIGLWDYFLDPRILSGGKMYKDLRCRNCFLVGHISKYCLFERMLCKKITSKTKNIQFKEIGIVR